MDRCMDRNNSFPSLHKSLIGSITAMRRTIVHYPEYSVGRSIRLLSHNLIYQLYKRLNSCFLFATAKYSRSMDIPRCQISQCASPLILMLMLNSHGDAWSRWQRFRLSFSRLNAGFFVSRNNVISWTKWLTLPMLFVQVKNQSRFSSKVGVTRKNPALILPRFESISLQPSPNCSPADICNDTMFNNMSSQICSALLNRDSGNPNRVGSSHANALMVMTILGGKSDWASGSWFIC